MADNSSKSKGGNSAGDGPFIERFPVYLHRLERDAVELWPEYLTEHEGRSSSEVDAGAWRRALMRDVYRSGPIVTKHTEAWMFYRASQRWSKELAATPADFIDPDDPEGPISKEGALALSEESRAEARRKLAWLACWLSKSIQGGSQDVVRGLSKIAAVSHSLEDRIIAQVDKHGVAAEGSVRDLFGCSPEEGLVVNAFLARWEFHDTAEGRRLQPPTVREIREFLESEGTEKSDPDIREILKKFGLAPRRGRPGRPKGSKGSA